MRKFYLSMVCAVLCTCLFYSCSTNQSKVYIDEEEEKEGYDGPMERDQFEADRLIDPALGYVPYTRLYDAMVYTEQLKSQLPQQRLQQALLWQERGPIFDSLGPSNGNTRAGVNYTAGRVRAVLVDTLNDPTGNTVFAGGVAGGLWRCTNFLSEIPNWTSVDDFFNNMAIAYICQNPANPSIMYFCTGEATSNADAVLGRGVWKSTDRGLTWTQLPSSVNFIRNFRILCDNAGNVYLASRTTAAPASNLNGLSRSTDGGATWTNITPTAQGTATATATCTDIEISSTGKLYASFGYATGAGTTVRPYVTNNPAGVSQASGWTLGANFRLSNLASVRLELAAIADTVYGVTINTAYNTDSCYKSVDGGQTWVKQNTTVLPGGLGSQQGWYNLTLTINPRNTNEILCGGLDAYRSTNGGANWTRHTFWVTTAPYVHADQHFMQWWYKDGESRILIGCDGGVFLTRDNGVTWRDKNRNLGIKQFYAGAIHPAAGSPYLIAGAQDNGVHQLKYPGLGPSIEVTGGDGCFVYINQIDPQIQFGSYVYNQYRRSTNGGQTWSGVNPSGSLGLFVNPFDYDDAQNTMYACWSANNIMRWPNANTANTTTVVPVTLLNGGVASALKVSPHTVNRVFLGSNGGRVLRLDNANATPTVTNITGTGMTGNVNCVNTGTSDNVLVAVMTNFGINNVWYTNDGGTNWSAIDGNLPDMPVRWALFEPGRDDRLILATETGIYSTDLVNGASTIWMPNTTFPTVRTDMIKMRTSDSTIVAATHGRGLYTAKIPAVVLPYVSFVQSSSVVPEQSAGTIGCRSYNDYKIGIGIVNPANGDATVNINVQSNGTALRVTDYDFTTNGNFTTPSNQLSFAAGTTGVKYLTLRVYDDAEVESPENFTFGFTVTGTTNAVPGIFTSHQITIADNDRLPIPYVNNGQYSIGTFNTDLTAGTTPFDATKLKHRVQVLYTAAELRAAGITTNAVLSAMRLRVKTKNSTQPFRGFTISMQNTTTATLSAGYVTGAFTQVWNGDYSTVAGDNNFNFTTPFNWNGTSNIVVQLCYDNNGNTADAAGDVVEGMGAPLGTGVRGSTYSNWTTSTAAGCAIGAAFVSDNRANATFTATFGDPVATALNSTKTESLAPFADLYYYNASREMMARVLNLSSHDYGCTEVVIDRAGNGVTQFWNTTTANYLMNKTFRVLPTNNNATGKYEVTFYFTKAEKDGWEAATGKPWDSIQIIKVPTRINNVTPLLAQPDGPGTVQVINAVRRTFGPGNFYTLTGIFENGFSGYGFGLPKRMNTILTLTGAPNSNDRDIDLSWTTSAEVNSSTFIVEKSYNGISYHQIGFVNAAGNKLIPSTYSFVDKENVLDNYYRIKMLHTDGYVLYSNVVYIKKNSAPQRLFIFPNPFVNNLTVRFARVPLYPVKFNFYDAAGKLVKQYQGLSGQYVYDINMTGIVSKGIYFMKVNVDGKNFTEKLMKQ
jgi:hypothetical protein